MASYITRSKAVSILACSGIGLAATPAISCAESVTAALELFGTSENEKVGDLQGLIDDLRSIASTMFQETRSFMDAYAMSMNEGSSDYAVTMEEYLDLNVRAFDAVEQLRAAFSGIEDETARTAEQCCGLLQQSMAFFYGYYHSSDPLMEFQQQAAQGAYVEQTDLLDAMYEAMGLVKHNYLGIDLPAFATDFWPLYVAQIDAYREKLYADYMSLVNNDPLMQASSLMLLNRQPYLLWRYEEMMYKSLCTQYANCYNMFSQGAGSNLVVDYRALDALYPNLYPSMDSLLNLVIYTDGGTRDVVVEVELDGFSQTYRKLLTATPEVKYLMIKPPVASNPVSMASERQTQLSLQISDAQSGQIIALESFPVTLHSVYDFTLSDNEFGIVEPFNLLAWLRPDAPEVLQIRRNAIDWLSANCGEGFDSLMGYQLGYPGVDEPTTTQLQCAAIQGAISDMGVRYNMGPFSFGGFQRVLTPDQVVQSRSGICIETAVLMASVLQSANMHPIILLLPGHAQVAVESWRSSGEYFLLETTMLPMNPVEQDIDAFLMVLTNEEWASYIQNNVNYVIDCNLVEELGIRGLVNG